MPKVIQYAAVLEQLQKQGLKSLYHNSGAFWFADGAETFSRGWIGPADASISPSARPLVRQAPPPFEPHLAGLFVRFLQAHANGPVLIMPKSHWAYELQFGSREWLGDALNDLGIEANTLSPLNNAAALEFNAGESDLLERFVCQLLAGLMGSDFQAVFEGCRTICTIHSRAQLWWTTVDSAVAEQLDVLLPPDASSTT